MSSNSFDVWKNKQCNLIVQSNLDITTKSPIFQSVKSWIQTYCSSLNSLNDADVATASSSSSSSSSLSVAVTKVNRRVYVCPQRQRAFKVLSSESNLDDLCADIADEFFAPLYVLQNLKKIDKRTSSNQECRLVVPLKLHCIQTRTADFSKSSRNLLGDGGDEKLQVKVKVYAISELPYFPMTLNEITPARDWMSTKQFVENYRAMFTALHQMHMSGICHNDIHSENILYDPSTSTMWLSDFDSIHSTDAFGTSKDSHFWQGHDVFDMCVALAESLCPPKKPQNGDEEKQDDDSTLKPGLSDALLENAVLMLQDPRKTKRKKVNDGNGKNQDFTECVASLCCVLEVCSDLNCPFVAKDMLKFGPTVLHKHKIESSLFQYVLDQFGKISQ